MEANNHLRCNSAISALVIFMINLFVLSGCTIRQSVFLQQDGSAVIRASRDRISQDDDFYKSNQISNLDVNNKSEISFTIDPIDSLGNYLSPIFKKDVFEFRYNHDTLSIKQLSHDVFHDEYEICCRYILEINTYRKIKSIETKNPYIKRKDDNIIISRSKQSFMNSNGNLNFLIILE